MEAVEKLSCGMKGAIMMEYKSIGDNWYEVLGSNAKQETMIFSISNYVTDNLKDKKISMLYGISMERLKN